MAVSNVELRVDSRQAVTALQSVNRQAQKFNQTVNGTSSKLKDANKGLKVLPGGLFATGNAAKGAAVGVGVMGAAMQTALLPLLGITTAVAALTKVFTNLSAQDFASAKIKTLGVEADVLKPKLATLSNELSGQASALQLLEASYDIASAGFSRTAELTDVLKASQLGATGGFSDLATVADATTSVLNAYGLSSDQAARLVDGFIQTQNDGKIVVDQYAQQIGRLAPIAAGAGVGINELNAAISTVTATGVPVESTFAGLRQVIAAIQKPTSEASAAAEKLGIDFSATALKTKGLGGVLEELVAKGGASEETLAQFFGSVEARTAILPLLNDQLVSFNQNLDNQANSQNKAAEAAFTAQNTIQGQLTRLGTAFTNLTTEGSEFGVVIRETLKVAAVTVEALGSAFKATMIPVRLLFGAVGEIGKVIGEALGIKATNVLFNLEQGWIGIKEAITDASEKAVFIGKVIGGVIGNSIKVIASFINGVRTQVGNLAQKIVDFFRQAFEKIVNLIPEPLKNLLGGLELPEIDFKIKGLQDFGSDVLQGAEENLNQLKEGVIEFSGVERQVTQELITENNKLLDVKNNIVKSNLKNGEVTDKNTDKIKKQVEEATELESAFEKVGDSIATNIRDSLVEAVKGTKSLGEMAKNILNDLANSLIKMGVTSFLKSQGGDFFSNLQFANGGRPPVGKASVVGERGPELFVPGTAGTIVPNDKIGGNTNNVVVNVDASGGSVQGSEDQGRALGSVISAAVQSALINESRPGGLLS